MFEEVSLKNIFIITKTMKQHGTEIYFNVGEIAECLKASPTTFNYKQ